jgi:hypothetical protein
LTRPDNVPVINDLAEASQDVVPSAAREQILACTDTTVLDGWLDRALDATSVEDVFA